MSKQVTLVQIAKQVKMSPKTARRILRARVTGHRSGKPWSFTETKAKQIASILKA